MPILGCPKIAPPIQNPKLKQPKRIFRDRRPPADPHDRRRAEFNAPVAPAPMPDLSSVMDPSRHMVWVPVHRFVEQDTSFCIRALEELGFQVGYSKGASAIDCTRNILATRSLSDGLDSILFIDADMMFSPEDAVRLFLKPELVVAGVYAAKVLGKGQLNACFPDDVKRIKLGQWATELTPVKRVGAGFLRIKTAALQTMVDVLKLPLCRMSHTRAYPFFQPMVVDEGDEPFYLTEDYAFCERCRLAGIQPWADTSFRLYHIGDYAYGWEEAAGQYIPRGRNLEYDFLVHEITN